MAQVEWRVRGPEIASCNCAWGCPCQFNALPTHGDCRAAVGMHVEEGHFGDVDLKGVKWCGMFAWPGPIHEGRGEVFAVVDPAASEAQRNAMLTILSGAESDPGANVFVVFASTLEKMHAPQFLPIDFALDINRRVGHMRIPGVLDVDIGPITNPVTGAEHRAKVVLPEGFEYREAEYASSRTHAQGPVSLGWDRGHAHVANLDLSPHGAA